LPKKVKINAKEDVIVIPNTSGSTGLPKGAMHTHYNLMATNANWQYDNFATF
jgi:4-coumarate--CoA ligase